MFSMNRFFFTTLIGLLLSACTVGPDYVRPCVVVPGGYKEAQSYKRWRVAVPQDTCNRGAWWHIFRDPELDMLENRLTIANQTIANAYANYQNARALVAEARASFFPIVSTSVAITRQQQQPINGGKAASFIGGATADTTPFTLNALMLNASWEPDIWGSVRRNVEAGVAGAQASQALLAATSLSSQASLAQYYFQLRGLDQDQKLLDDTVKSYKKALSLTQNRYKFGVAGRVDVIQAQSQYDSARALAFNNGILRGQYEHAIAVLIGLPPADFNIDPRPRGILPPYIPAEIPSELLERRPDIAQAERLMAQANAQIGVAIAAYFPTLTLSGLGTSQSIGSIGHWLRSAAYGWSVGPQLAETLFDGGLRRATTRAARANYDAAVANYRQVVLAAFQNVEDNLVSQRLLRLQSEAQNKAATNARRALNIVLNEYKAGTVSYTDVLTAQNADYTAEKTAIDVTYLRMTTAVGLIKALGGNWDTTGIVNP